MKTKKREVKDITVLVCDYCKEECRGSASNSMGSLHNPGKPDPLPWQYFGEPAWQYFGEGNTNDEGIHIHTHCIKEAITKLLKKE